MVGQLIILYRNFTFNATKYAIKCSEVTLACFTVYKVTDLLVVGNISGYKKKAWADRVNLLEMHKHTQFWNWDF